MTSGADPAEGGNVSARTTVADLVVAFAPLQPNQEAVVEHNQRGVEVKAKPQAILVLIPAKQLLGFFMKLLDPGAPERIFHHDRQRRISQEVAPEVLGITYLTAPRPLADQ